MRKLVESPTDLYTCLLEVFRRAGCIVIIASMGAIAITTESLRTRALTYWLLSALLAVQLGTCAQSSVSNAAWLNVSAFCFNTCISVSILSQRSLAVGFITLCTPFLVPQLFSLAGCTHISSIIINIAGCHGSCSRNGPLA